MDPAKAEAIIEDRNKNGPFNRMDDLNRMKGFGKNPWVSLLLYLLQNKRCVAIPGLIGNGAIFTGHQT